MYNDRFLDCMVISLDNVSMYNDRFTYSVQSKNLLPNYSASSLTLVGRYTVDLSLYMDTLSRLITGS
jgi:hypothetical protein